MLFEYHSGQRWCCSGLCQTAVFHERWFIYAALWLSASLSHCIQYFGLNVVKSSKLGDEFSMVACYSHMIILVGVMHSTIIVRWEMLASTRPCRANRTTRCGLLFLLCRNINGDWMLLSDRGQNQSSSQYLFGYRRKVLHDLLVFGVKGQCDFTDCKNLPGESRYSNLLQSQYAQSYATGLQK